MGMGIMRGSASRGSESRAECARLPGDPDPKLFEILRLESFGPYCVALIRWPGASNYEGTKLALYQASEGQLRAATRLDPHFNEQRGPLVPVARFEPTENGVRVARAVAILLLHSDGKLG